MAPAPLVLFRGATKSPALMPLIDEEFMSEVLARVNVVGTSGSGKSTFARLLASKLELPVIEMDALYWDRNWSEPSDEVFFTRLRAALAQPRWVLDGNYDRTLPIKWQAATTVIWLDYSLPRTLLQSLQRALLRAWTKTELWPGTGNRESFRMTFFSKKSVLLWSLRSHARLRARYRERLHDPAFAHIKFYRLRSPSDARRFLLRVSTLAASG